MISELVDVDRYPVDRLDSQLVEQCRDALRRNGAVNSGGSKSIATAASVLEKDVLYRSADPVEPGAQAERDGPAC